MRTLGSIGTHPASFIYRSEFTPCRGSGRSLWAIAEPQRTSLPSTQADAPSSRPAFPVRLLTFIYGVALLTQIIFYLIPVQLPFYLKELANANVSQSGLAIALATLFSAMASLFYAKIKQRLSFFSVLVVAFGLMGVGYSLIGLVEQYALVLVGLAIAGAGLGLLMPNLNLWVSSEVSDAARGRALGGATTFFFLGQFLSPAANQSAYKSSSWARHNLCFGRWINADLWTDAHGVAASNLQTDRG